VVIDGGDGVSSVGEWIDVAHDGVEGLCIDTGEGVVSLFYRVPHTSFLALRDVWHPYR